MHIVRQRCPKECYSSQTQWRKCRRSAYLSMHGRAPLPLAHTLAGVRRCRKANSAAGGCPHISRPEHARRRTASHSIVRSEQSSDSSVIAMAHQQGMYTLPMLMRTNSRRQTRSARHNGGSRQRVATTLEWPHHSSGHRDVAAHNLTEGATKSLTNLKYSKLRRSFTPVHHHCALRTRRSCATPHIASCFHRFGGNQESRQQRLAVRGRVCAVAVWRARAGRAVRRWSEFKFPLTLRHIDIARRRRLV
jgi:hypothetical protein